jgi:hypothetical protein
VWCNSCTSICRAGQRLTRGNRGSIRAHIERAGDAVLLCPPVRHGPRHGDAESGVGRSPARVLSTHGRGVASNSRDVAGVSGYSLGGMSGTARSPVPAPGPIPGAAFRTTRRHGEILRARGTLHNRVGSPSQGSELEVSCHRPDSPRTENPTEAEGEEANDACNEGEKLEALVETGAHEGRPLFGSIRTLALDFALSHGQSASQVNVTLVPGANLPRSPRR